MFPYWLALTWYAVGAMNNPQVPRDQRRQSPLLLGSLLLLVLFVGLRFQVGADWTNYLDIFDYARDLSVGEILAYSDPGYMVLNGVAAWMDVDIWLVNLVCASIFVWGLSRFVTDEPNPWLAVAVAIPYLVIVVAMGYTRQSVAIGMMLAAIPMFKQARYGQFLAYFLVAALFHKTAIIILPLIVASTVRHRFMVYVAGGTVAAMLFVVLFQQFLDAMLVGYVEQGMSSDGAGIRVAMNIVPAVLFLLFQRRFVISEQERQLWRNFSVAALAAGILLAVLSSSTLVDRLALYLLPIQIFALGRLPFAFPRYGRPSSALTLAVIVYSAAVQFVWLGFASHADKWLPYQTFLLQD